MPYELESELEEMFAKLERDPCDQRLKGTRVAVVGGAEHGAGEEKCQQRHSM